MKEIVAGISLIILGGGLIAFSKSFARECIEQQNKTWSFHFGGRAINAARIVTVIGGTGVIILGLLSLFGIIQFRGG